MHIIGHSGKLVARVKLKEELVGGGIESTPSPSARDHKVTANPVRSPLLSYPKWEGAEGRRQALWLRCYIRLRRATMYTQMAFCRLLIFSLRKLKSPLISFPQPDSQGCRAQAWGGREEDGREERRAGREREGELTLIFTDSTGWRGGEGEMSRRGDDPLQDL